MPDEIIHQSMRLKIMAALNMVRQKDGVEFTQLKSLLATTDGNLGAHLETLSKANYVVIDKRSDGKRPRTYVRATPAGRRAFVQHVAYLREIFDAAKI